MDEWEKHNNIRIEIDEKNSWTIEIVHSFHRRQKYHLFWMLFFRFTIRMKPKERIVFRLLNGEKWQAANIASKVFSIHNFRFIKTSLKSHSFLWLIFKSTNRKREYAFDCFHVHRKQWKSFENRSISFRFCQLFSSKLCFVIRRRKAALYRFISSFTAIAIASSGRETRKRKIQWKLKFWFCFAEIWI